MKTLPVIDKKKREKLELFKRQALIQSQTPDTIISDALEHEESANHNQKKKHEKPGRTIETMFRITSSNSQKLSDQADTKAHIMISVNVIIISIVLTVLIRNMYEYTSTTVPLTMLISTSLATIIFSIIATRPNIPKGSFSQKELRQKNTNLLFFGNFYNMKFEEYCNGMLSVIDDKQYLYQSLLRDLYCQGVVLGRKYKMLKIAYSVFMWGLIVSIGVFMLAFTLTAVLFDIP